MKITRSSKHILKYQTDTKTDYLNRLFEDYKKELQSYIDLIWDEKIPLEKFISSKELPNLFFKHSQWKQIIYKQASEIIRSNIEKKKTSKPEIKFISIPIDSRLFDTDQNSKEFDEFIKIRLPYFYANKHRARSINLPIRQHKQSLKYKNWNRKRTIRLIKNSEKDTYFVEFIYEKEIIEKQNGDDLGLDLGYNKLISDSNGNHYGKDLKDIYQKISRKKQGSKSFKRSLKERNQKINFSVNQIDLSNLKLIVIENLKNVKKNSKKNKFVNSKFMNKLQRWSYSKTTNKIEQFCYENGVQITKIDPSYTSQKCSNCGHIDSKSRNNEIFECICCKVILDADTNAAKNILQRGVYNPSFEKINSVNFGEN